MHPVRWFLLAVVAGTLGAADARAAKSPRVEFRATLEKSSSASNDPIPVSFTLKNTGSQPVWVNARFYLSCPSAAEDDRDVTLTVTGPSGKELPCTFSYPTGLPKSEYFKQLEAGQEAAAEYPRDLRGFVELKAPGTYTLRAVYHNVFGAELGLEAFKGPLTAEPVSFTITQ